MFGLLRLFGVNISAQDSPTHSQWLKNIPWELKIFVFVAIFAWLCRGITLRIPTFSFAEWVLGSSVLAFLVGIVRFLPISVILFLYIPTLWLLVGLLDAILTLVEIGKVRHEKQDP